MAGIRRIDHLALAVKDLEKSISFFETFFGAKYLFRTKHEGMTTAMLQIGEDILSLESEAMDGDGFVAQFLRSRGEGVHHIGVEIDNMDDLVEKLKGQGIRIPEWRLPGDFSARKEIVLGTKVCFGNVLQIVEWSYGTGETIEDRFNHIDKLFSI